MIFNDLVLFTTVSCHLSFSEAASELGIPLSRISRRIADLEDRLQVKLFERTTRQVRLTEEGRHLLDRCQEPIEALRGIAGFADDASKHTIRVTAPPMAVQSRIGARLLDFAAAHPDIRLDVTATNAVLDFFRDNIDLAFRVGPLKDSTLVARRLWTLTYGFCASERFVERYDIRQPIELDRVLELPSLLSRQPWLLTCGLVKPRTVMHDFDTLDLLAGAAQRDMGVAVLPHDMIGANLKEITVLNASPIDRAMYAVYPDKRLLPARIRDLIDFMTVEEPAN